MKKLLLSIFVLGICFLELKGDNVPNRFSANVHGGIYANEQAWIIEPEMLWHFHNLSGISFGIELTRQYNQPNRQAIIDGHEAELTNNERNIGWIVFKPAIILRTPDLWLNTCDDMHLWLQTSAGISLACPFSNSLTYEIREFNGNMGTTIAYREFKNNGLNWFYWNSRFNINFSFDRFILGVGYGISNFDYYSCRRNVILGNNIKFYVPRRELSHSIFISFGYKL